MATIINRFAFKNFYNYYGDYAQNSYYFKTGLNIINADNGMGKSKCFNGILWILRDQIYDSDTRSIKSARLEPLKMLSDRAKLCEISPECGVIIEFEDDRFRYSIEKRIKFTKKVDDASTSNPDDWNISEAFIDINKTDLYTNNSTCVYDIEEQEEIIKNKLINSTIQPYALLQGEAIDEIVDLSNSSKLTNTIETLTDIKELNVIEKSCTYFSKLSRTDLKKKQETCTENRAQFEDLQKKIDDLEKKKDNIELQISKYKEELQKATEKVKSIQSQIANTEERVKYQTLFKKIEKEEDELHLQIENKLATINENIFRSYIPWILIGTEGKVGIFTEIKEKYSEERLKRKIKNNPTELISTLGILPEGSPDDVSLEKMLKEHICFVCGKPFEEGDDSHKHIQMLRNRSKSLSLASEKKESDMHNFFDSIHTSVAKYINTDHIFGSIAKERVAIKELQNKLKKKEEEKEDAKSSFFNYGGNKTSLFGESDQNLLSLYNKALWDIEHYKKCVTEAQNHISEIANNIKNYEDKLSNLGGDKVPAQYAELVDVISDATQIFDNTKKRIYDEVISNLEKKSNEYYKLLTEGNNVLGGTMRFEKTSYDAIEVKVINDKGDELSGASEGFQRMKKIAVVMAIISSKIGEKKFNYPFIADAPFSAFGKNFINNFFKTVPSVFNQSIILIKDLYDINDKIYLSDEGRNILEKMKNGEMEGTFYVNFIEEESDPTKLETKILIYKK